MCTPLSEQVGSLSRVVRVTTVYKGNPINGGSACQNFFSRGTRVLLYRGHWLNTLVMTPGRHMLCMTITIAGCWLMFMCVLGCSARSILNKPPAQQQSNKTSFNPPMVRTPDIPVELVDVDQDGTITAQERQNLVGDQPSVIGTFATIIGLVLLASIGSAWASAKWKPKDAADVAPDPPLAPHRQVSEVDFMGDTQPEEPAAPDKQRGDF